MNRIRVAFAALVLPIALGAQAAPATPPANPITGSFLQMGSRYSHWLTTAFDSIPADKYSFKPTPVQMTVGAVASHLEAANYLLCSRFSGMTRSVTARDSLADSLKSKWPKDTLVARLKASFDFCDKAMATVTDPRLAEQLPAGPPGSGQTAERSRYVLIYVLDLVDHYSQIANYMRLNNMIPPSAQRRPGT